MTVRELIELLEDMRPEAEVRLAEQPRHPFQYNLRGLVEAYTDDSGNWTVDLEDASDEGMTPVVFFVEGSPVHPQPYLPGVVADEAWA